MRYDRHAMLASVAMFALVGTTGTVFAQATGGLEEITVTAQRRTERLQDIPLAVSAFSPAELERRNVADTKALIQYIPNLQGNNNTGLGTANVYFLRGLGNSESVATFDPPVGTYVDDIYLARQNANNFSFFDLESIEVLRGPQGTLFGRNTSGGAINVKLRKPAETFGGSAEIGTGSYSRALARGTVDVPISDKFLTQASAYYNHTDGYVNDYTTGQKLNGVASYGVRGAFTAKASDMLTWNVAVNHMYSNELNTLNFTCTQFDSGVASLGAPANCSGRFAANGLRRYGSGQSSLSNLVIGLPSTGTTPIVANSSFVPATLSNNLANNEMGNKTNQTIVSSNIQADVNDNLTLNAITGYVHLGQKYLFEYQDGRSGRSLAAPNPAVPVLIGPAGTVSPNGSFVLASTAKSEEFTQELKATGSIADGFFKYVAGAYYYHDTNDTNFADIVSSALRTTVSGDRSLNNKTTSVAGYFQGDVHFTEQFFATAGIRYTDERKTIAIHDNRDSRVAPVVAGVLRPDLRLETANLTAFGFPTKLVTKLWTPHFALNYKVTDDALVFATATRGFRSGGWNVRGGDISSFAPFYAEKVWTYEAGFKTEWLDRRLRLNATVFDSEVTGFQLPSSFVQANGTPTFITQNAGDFRNRGAELELQALPMDGLTIFGTLGYQDAKYKNIPAATTAQQNSCLAARNAATAAGTNPNVAGAGLYCAVGIVTYDGKIATPARVPKWNMSLGASYEIQTTMGVTLTPSVNVTHSSSFETAGANLSFYVNAAGVYNVTGDGKFVSGSRTAPYTVVNASFAVETDDKLWRAVVDCDNCFGAVWSQSSVSGYSFINPPGTWSLRLRRKF